LADNDRTEHRLHILKRSGRRVVVEMVHETMRGDLLDTEAVDRIARSESVESMRMTDCLDVTNIANAREVVAVAVAVYLPETRGAEGGVERMVARIAIGGWNQIEETWKSGITRG